MEEIGGVRAFFAMLRDVRKGRYPAPWGMFAWIFLFIVYFISPIDLIPDFIFPPLGFTDDAAFAFFTYKSIKKEVKKYKESLARAAAENNKRGLDYDKKTG